MKKPNFMVTGVVLRAPGNNSYFILNNIKCIQWTPPPPNKKLHSAYCMGFFIWWKKLFSNPENKNSH